MNFMVLSLLIAWYTNWSKCSGYFTTWLGVFPLEVVVTGGYIPDCHCAFDLLFQ
jgi:hypothetical protein